MHVGFCEPGLLRSSELRFMARPWYPLFLLHGEPLRGALMDLMEDDEVTAHAWVLELIFAVSLPEKVELIKNIIILQYPKPPACKYFDNPAGLGIARRMDQRTGKYVNSSIDLLMRAWPEYNGVSLSLFAAKTVILDCVCMQLKYDTPIEKLLNTVKSDYPAVFNQVGRRGDPFLVLTWRSYFFLLSQLFDVNAAIARDLLEFVETERKNSTVVVDKMAVVSFGSMAYNFPKYGFGDDDHGFSRKNKNVQLLPHGQKPLHMCSFIDVTHTGGKRDRFASAPLSDTAPFISYRTPAHAPDPHRDLLLLGLADKWIDDFIAKNAAVIQSILEIRKRTGFGGLYESELQVRELVRICARLEFSVLAYLSCRKPSGQSFRVVAKSPRATTARTASPRTRYVSSFPLGILTVCLSCRQTSALAGATSPRPRYVSWFASAPARNSHCLPFLAESRTESRSGIHCWRLRQEEAGEVFCHGWSQHLPRDR